MLEWFSAVLLMNGRADGYARRRPTSEKLLTALAARTERTLLLLGGTG